MRDQAVLRRKVRGLDVHGVVSWHRNRKPFIRGLGRDNIDEVAYRSKHRKTLALRDR